MDFVGNNNISNKDFMFMLLLPLLAIPIGIALAWLVNQIFRK